MYTTYATSRYILLQRLSEACGLQHALSAKPRRQAGGARHSRSGYTVAVEKEDGSGWVATQPLVSAYVVPGDKARAVPPAIGARGGGDSRTWVGAASRREAITTVRSLARTHRGGVGARLWCKGRREAQWKGRRAGGEAERSRGNA
jgi:hypothetical protein